METKNNILKQSGISNEEFEKMQNEWAQRRPSMDAKYLQSPEGKLLDAIYNKKN